MGPYTAWRASDAQFHALVTPDGGLHHLTLQRVPKSKTVKNRAHLDLFVDDLPAELARLAGIAAEVVAAHDGRDDGYTTTVMTHPDRNELCVVQQR